MTAADYATRVENARCLLTVFAAAGPTSTSYETNVVCGVVNELLKKARPNDSATPAEPRAPLTTLRQVAESARQLEKLLWVVSGAASNEGATEFPRDELESVAFFMAEIASDIREACESIGTETGQIGDDQ